MENEILQYILQSGNSRADCHLKLFKALVVAGGGSDFSMSKAHITHRVEYSICLAGLKDQIRLAKQVQADFNFTVSLQ